MTNPYVGNSERNAQNPFLGDAERKADEQQRQRAKTKPRSILSQAARNTKDFAEQLGDIGGITGNIADALGAINMDPSVTVKQRFMQNRDARQARRDASPALLQFTAGALQAALPLPGAKASLASNVPKFATLTSAVMKDPRWRAYLTRAGVRAAEGVSQSAVQAYGENVGTTTGTAAPVGYSAMLSAVLAPLIGGAAGKVSNALAKRRVGGMSGVEQDVAEYLADAEKLAPSRAVSTIVGGPEETALDLAGEYVQNLGIGASRSQAGQIIAKQRIGSRADKEFAAMQEAVRNATGIAPVDADDMVRDAARLGRERDAGSALDAAQHKETARAGQAANDEARAAANRTLTVDELVDALEASAETPDVYSFLDAHVSARKIADETNYTAVKKLSGIPADINMQDWDDVTNIQEGKEIWTAIKRLRRSNRPGVKPMPTMMVGEREIEIPDELALLEFKVLSAHLSGNDPTNLPYDKSPSVQLAQREVYRRIGAMQGKTAREADKAHKASQDTERALVSGMEQQPLLAKDMLAGSWQAELARRALLETNSPGDASLARAGGQFATVAELLDGLSPTAFRTQLESPRSAVSQRIIANYPPGSREKILAGTTRPDAPGRYVPPDAPAARPVSPQEEQLTRGLNIFESAGIPSGGNFNKSMAELEDYIGSLSPAEQKTARKAIAAAFQDKLEKSQRLGLTVPANRRQLNLATTSEGTEGVARAEAAWERSNILDNALFVRSGLEDIPDPSGLLRKGVNVVRPNTIWTLSNIGRELARASGDKALEAQAVVLMRILMDQPGSIQEKIAQLAKVRGKNAAVANRTAAIMGRAIGSSLPSRGEPQP